MNSDEKKRWFDLTIHDQIGPIGRQYHKTCCILYSLYRGIFRESYGANHHMICLKIEQVAPPKSNIFQPVCIFLLLFLIVFCDI